MTRCSIRKTMRPSLRALIVFTLCTSAAAGCADDTADPEPRPSADELLEFYAEFCGHW